MIAIAILLLILYMAFMVVVIQGIGKGKFAYLLIYIALFLPFYVVFLSFIYDHTESAVLINFLKYSKELIIFYGLLIWLLGRKKNLGEKQWKISTLDYLFAAFMLLSFFYTVIPLGEATIFNKFTYLKNILLMCLAYFFGRQIIISNVEWKGIFKVIFVVTTFAFLVVICERFFGTHFHSLIGYAKYNLAINDIEPAGNYGLIWTFEAQAGQPRYGAFFSNPLEFAASMLICFSLAIAHLLSVKYNMNRAKYLMLLFFAFICVLLAYSRATMVAFFGTMVFMAFLLRYYKILVGAGLTAACIGLYVWFLASDDTRYFVMDTLTFQNSSSITHVLEWVEGIDSLIQNPLGIGLAMSGNTGGVETDLKVSGENQFLIYGVQLGVLGMIIYLLMIIYSIRHCWKAFRLARGDRQDQIVPFVAASVKFGLLLPLLTANAESYLYVALVSWWMVGFSESLYQKLRASALKNKSQNIDMSLGISNSRFKRFS